MKKQILGIDIGGSKTAFGVFAGEKPVYTGSIPTEAGRGIPDLCARVRAQLGAYLHTIAGVGLACPGPLDLERGRIIRVATTGWKDVPVAAIFSDAFDAPAALVNDGGAGALGEYWYGVGKGCRNLAYIAAGTGVGGGIILNGTLYRGAGNAGEFGHIPVPMAYRERCPCGNENCTELYASGVSMEKAYALSAGEPLKLPDIFLKAKAGEAPALEVFRTAARALGAALTGIAKILDPDLAVFGGGAARTSEVLFPLIRAELTARSVSLPLAVNGLGGMQGVYGAAKFYLLNNENKKINIETT
jgi:glucokinase